MELGKIEFRNSFWIQIRNLVKRQIATSFAIIKLEFAVLIVFAIFFEISNSTQFVVRCSLLSSNLYGFSHVSMD